MARELSVGRDNAEFLLARHGRTQIEGGPWSGADDESERCWTNGEAEPECPLDAIWMGDFNSVPESAEYRRITGDNPYHPNAAYFAGFRDAATLSGETGPQLFTHVREIGGVIEQRRLDYCFVGSMLAWPPGPRESDGVWGRYWYDAVWKSTRFVEFQPRNPQLDGLAAAVAEECLPIYERLHEARWVLPESGSR